MNDVLTQTTLIPLALGLILSEFTEVSPWLARRILRLAAHRLDDPEYSERYEAEWVALLDERPGKLLKLFFASWIALRSTWQLRAIHRRVNTSGTSSDPTTAPQGEQPPRRWIRTSLGRARIWWSGGYYRAGHYYPDRRRWGSNAAQRRRRRNAALGLCGAAAWMLAGPGDAGVTQAVVVGIVFPLLIALAFPFSRRRLRRLDSRLAAASLQQEDWSLGFVRVPSDLVREFRRGLAAGGEMHITDTEPGGDKLVRVVDITSSGLAFVLRPRRRRKR